MLKRYPCTNCNIEKVVFDYRLLRTSRIIENSFGILAARFKIFRRPINTRVETICSITKATVTLQLSYEVSIYIWRIHVLPSRFR